MKILSNKRHSKLPTFLIVFVVILFVVAITFNTGDYFTIVFSDIAFVALAWIYLITNKGKHRLKVELEEVTKALDSSALISETDSNGAIVSINDNFLEVSQYSRKELIGKTHRMIRSNEHTSDFFKEMWNTINRGEQWSGTIKNKAKDGSFYWVNSTIYPRIGLKGEIKGFVSIRYDITKQMEQKIEIDQKNTHINLALDSSNLGIWDWNVKEKMVFFDKRVLHLLGLNENYLKTDLLIKNKWIHPKDIEQYHKNMKSYLDGEVEVFKCSYRIKHYDGHWIYILDQGKVSKRDKKGRPLSLTGTYFDLTSQKEYEKKLRIAKTKAEEAQRVKSQFLANMSHEIRTPLNGVLGMIELLKETKLSIKQEDMLETTKSCGESLLRILNDILDISKIESGKIEIENISFDLRKCISDAIFLFSYIAKEKGIRLHFKDTQDELWFKGDMQRIKQIIVNYISNAVKFTSMGEVLISVNIKESEKNKPELSINVKDTGIGVSEDSHKSIFNAFSQENTSITREYGGTGLGLSICSNLASLMGGKTLFVSEKGVGSIFSLKIRLERSLPENKRNNKTLKSLPTLNFKEGNVKRNYQSSQKILVVEDNIINQKLVKMMLSKIGYDCDIAINGIEALKALKKSEEENYSLIFMDIQMPEMDGLTATKEIVKRYKNNAPPIVAMTANAYDEDKKNCINAGMDDFISKPIPMSELERVMDKYGFTSNQELEDNVNNNIQKTQLFDLGSLMKAFKDDEDVLFSIIEEFDNQIPEHITKIREGVLNNNYTQLEITFHTLKGIARSFHSLKIGESACKLESDSKASKGLDDKEVDHFIEELKALSHQLKELIIGEEEVA